MTDTIRQDTLEAISPGVIVALNSCVEACIDGEKGYALAAANVRDPMLKVLLRRYAAQRAEFIADAQAPNPPVPRTREFKMTNGRTYRVSRRAAATIRPFAVS